MPIDPHAEFRELCALSTTGELTPEEWSRLTEHLAGCKACRKVKEQYDQVAERMMPAFAAEAQNESKEDSEEDPAQGSWSIDAAEARLMASLAIEPVRTENRSAAVPSPRQWLVVWKFAIAALLFLAGAFTASLFGVHEARRTDILARQPFPSKSAETIGSPIPGRSTGSGKGELPRSGDGEIASLRKEVAESRAASERLKDQINQLEDRLAKNTADLDQSLAEKAGLNGELAQAKSDSDALEARVAAVGNQTSQDAAELQKLKTQVSDLNQALEEKNQEVAHEQELLGRDRDIRNLIGARNLYIAEIYDVGKNGDIEKPFGRVFYTKDKSLIFYGYDLDQQKGVRKDASFQAWGRRGPDGRHDVSLGLLYQDDANQKRWVLKFNDSKTISELDAVFITAEPGGGSSKPSTKPLLFTYLHIDPNHP